MCGIAGQIRFDGKSVDPELVHRMCAVQEHRGPDSRGIYCHKQAGLGIQRLRVIDLQTGDQPIYNEDRTIVVVLNGEIYNFRDLRKQLERRGHRFSTASDTEVIVHAYEEHGPDCVKELHGMFAFALWDERKGTLLLARDRVGKKPLYYSVAAGKISFASELPALMQDEEISHEIDPAALDCYLAYQYVAAPMSIYRSVRKLPPATTMTFDAERIELERYWRLDYANKRPIGDVRELHEELREIIRRAVRRRLVADVPLGAFLSGGIDSSAVVAAMAEASTAPVKTFSIGFENAAYNELPYARQVAERFATDHHEFVVRPDAISMIPRIVRHYGEPFGDSSALPSFCVSELTRRHVTVALNGDGGDESFGGYNRYIMAGVAGRFDQLPHALRRGIAALGGLVPPGREVRSTRDRLRRFTGSLPLDPAERYARGMSSLHRAQRRELYSEDYFEHVRASPAEDVIRNAWAAASGQSALDVMLEVDVSTLLPGDLLTKIDIASMAHSLEARSPLLDPEVMEFAASLPPELKVRGANKKVILRDSLRGWLPDTVLDRRKYGFEIPVAEWFRTDLRGYIRDVLLDPDTLDRGYFRPQRVSQLIGRHLEGRQDNSRELWGLLMLELWQREYAVRPGLVPSYG